MYYKVVLCGNTLRVRERFGLGAEDSSYFELNSLSEKELIHFELFFDQLLAHFIKLMEAYQSAEEVK